MPEINNSEKLLHNLSRDLIRRAICLKQFQEAITLAGLVQLVKSVWEKEKPPEGLSEEEKKKFKVTPTEMQQKVIKWLLDMEEVLELFIHAEKLLLRYFPETFETIQSICYLLEGRTQSALVSEFSINDPMVLLPSSFVKATNNRFKRDSRVIETIIGRPTSRRTWNSFHLESFIPLRESTDKYIDAPSLMHISTLNEKVEVKPNGDIYSKVLFRHAKTGNRTFVPPVVNSKTILHAHGDEFWRNFLRELNKYVAMTPVSLFYFLLHILTSFIGTSIDSKAFVLILCPHDSGKSTLSRLIFRLLCGVDFVAQSPREIEKRLNVYMVSVLDNLDSLKGEEKDALFSNLSRNTIQTVDTNGISNDNLVILNATKIEGIPITMELRSLHYKPTGMSPAFDSVKLNQFVDTYRDEFYLRTAMLLQKVVGKPNFQTNKAAVANLVSDTNSHFKKVRETMAVMCLLAEELGAVANEFLGMPHPVAFKTFLRETNLIRQDRIVGAPNEIVSMMQGLFSKAIKDPDRFRRETGLEYDSVKGTIRGAVVAGWVKKVVSRNLKSIGSSNEFRDRLTEASPQLEAIGYVLKKDPVTNVVVFSNNSGIQFFTIQFNGGTNG